MLIDGAIISTYIGEQAQECMKLFRLDYKSLPRGDILVDDNINGAYGIHNEPIVNKDAFGRLVLASWESKKTKNNVKRNTSPNN